MQQFFTPPVRDTWDIEIRMNWTNDPDAYNYASFKGYTSAANVICAADVFSNLGEDILLVFKDAGQDNVEYNGQRIQVKITHNSGGPYDTVRY